MSDPQAIPDSGDARAGLVNSMGLPERSPSAAGSPLSVPLLQGSPLAAPGPSLIQDRSSEPFPSSVPGGAPTSSEPVSGPSEPMPGPVRSGTTLAASIAAGSRPRHRRARRTAPGWSSLPSASLRRGAFVALVALLSLALILTWLPGASYSAQDREHPAEAASRAHLAGTDALGRDRLTRVAAGTLLGFAGASSAAALTTVLAAAVGLLAALGPRLLAAPLLLVTDAFLALPWLFLLMMVRAGLPLSTPPLLLAACTFLLLGLLGWPACAHAVHVGASRLRGAPAMLQARAAGLSPTFLARHLAPQLGPLLLPQFLVSVPAFLLAEANLGTLGLGVGEPLPSWGSMLAELENSPVLLGTSHAVFLPLAVLLVSLALLELLLPEV